MPKRARRISAINAQAAAAASVQPIRTGAGRVGPAATLPAAGSGETGTSTNGAGAGGTGFSTRTGSGGNTGSATASVSMPSITAVQTACRPAADFTRSSGIASAAKPASTIERTPTLARYPRTFALSSISLSLAVLPLRDALRQTLQFALIHNVVVHHPDQQLLHRAAAEALDDLPHRLGCDTLRRVDAAVHIGAALDAMAHVALLLEPLEYGAGGRFLHGMTLGQFPAHLFRRCRPAAPDHFHDELFQLAQSFSGSVSAKHCSATKCSARGGRCQGLFLGRR